MGLEFGANGPKSGSEPGASRVRREIPKGGAANRRVIAERARGAPALTPECPRILIATDQRILGELLSVVFARRGHWIDLAPEPSPAAILAMVRETGQGLALLDVELRRGVPGGLKVIRSLREDGVRVIAFAPACALTLRAAYAKAGVHAIASRSQTLDELVALVERVLAGHVVLTPAARAEIIAAGSSNGTSSRECAFDRLTAKEKLALIGLVSASSVQQIAATSGVSTATVRGRLQSIRSKLGATSQLALIAEAHNAGWPRPRDGTT
jgi:DNA-binding NarL/FixJ family response regulator